jgi:hypothetical protein
VRADDALRVLGVPASATPGDIKAAYRRLVKASHPDRHGSDEQRRAEAEESLKGIIEAYRCLRNGVPPLDAPASMFSIRQAPPPRRRRSRSVPTRGDWIRNLWPVAVAVLVMAAIGILLVSMEEKSTQQPASPVQSLVKIRAGRDWRVENPTGRTFLGCTALVGAKRLTIETVNPHETLELPAADFSPELNWRDDDRELELVCRWAGTD